MTGFELVFFWVILMPLTFITLGLLVDRKIIRGIKPRPRYDPPEHLPLLSYDIEDKVQAIVEAKPRNPRLIKEKELLAQWDALALPKIIHRGKLGNLSHSANEECYYCKEEK